jgi:hypothetical protein
VSLRSNCHLLSHTESEAIAPTEILTSRPERLPFLNSVKCKFSDCIGRYPGSCHSGSDSGCRSICPVHVLYANIRWDILSMGRPAAVNQVRCWCHPPPPPPPPPPAPPPPPHLSSPARSHPPQRHPALGQRGANTLACRVQTTRGEATWRVDDSPCAHTHDDRGGAVTTEGSSDDRDHQRFSDLRSVGRHTA